MLEGFTTDKENFEIYATEKGTVKDNAIPSDATFKDYKLVSSNTKIVTISSKTQFVGKAAGSTTIKVVSTNYENIIKTFNVTVLEQPEITDFSITNSNIAENSFDSNLRRTSSLIFIIPSTFKINKKGMFYTFLCLTKRIFIS